MRLQIEAATDAAMLAFFDPGALPDDFSTEPDNPCGLFGAPGDDGRVWVTQTGSDGRYLFHVYVDEEPAGETSEFLADPVIVERLRVPSGTVHACGAEWSGSPTDQWMGNMGGAISIPPGEYRATFWRTEFPPDHVDRLFAAKHGEAALSDARRPGVGCLIGLVGAAIGVGGIVAAVTRESFVIAGVAIFGMVAVWALGMRWANRAPEKPTTRLYREFQREFPSLVVRLKRVQP